MHNTIHAAPREKALPHFSFSNFPPQKKKKKKSLGAKKQNQNET
jgi:hypothetical protein